MADYGFIARPSENVGLRPISELLGMAGQAQQLQSGNLMLQKQAQTLQADIARSQSEARRATAEAAVSEGTAQPRIAQGQITSEQSALALTAGRASILRNAAGALFRDPAIREGTNPEKIHEALVSQFDEAVRSGVPKPMALAAFGELSQLARNPTMLLEKLRTINQQEAGAGQRAGVINAPVTMFNTGREAFPLQLQSGAPGGIEPVPLSATRSQGPLMAPQPQVDATRAPQGVPMTTSPESAERSGIDLLGRPIIETRSPFGHVNYKAPPGTAYRPIMSLPPDLTPEAAKRMAVDVEKAPEEIKNVANERFNNQQILRLTAAAFTGTGGPELAHVLNAVGIQKTNDAGADTSQLRHFLALQVEKNAASIGANSDAARQLAERAVLPTDSPEKAVKAITKINDSFALGRELYSKGLLKAVHRSDNDKDVLAARDYQVAWSQNFDPNVMRLIRGDREEVAKELGPERLKALLAKYRNLKALSETGRLP